MITLSAPSMALYDSWAAAVTEFGGRHIDGSGLSAGASSDRSTCQELITKAQVSADVGRPITDGRVHCTYYWITDAPQAAAEPSGTGEPGRADTPNRPVEVVGFVALRHRLNDFLAGIGGHIGYSVRPSRRRQGIATRALELALDRTRELGIDRVLITCNDDNVGSYRTIENCGGKLADVRDRSEQGYGLVRRYWIELDPAE